jgi:hypothetical protein
MRLTETEAKNKCCPIKPTNCVGSACMAWRKAGERITFTGQEIMVRQPGGGGRIERERVVEDEGECGFVRGSAA